MTGFNYPVNLTQDEEGIWLAVVPDVPGAAEEGRTRAEALAEVADALEEALASLLKNNEPLPAPSLARKRPLVSPGVTMAAKLALHEAMRARGLTKVALAALLDWDEREVRRLLDPAAATKVPRIEVALRALGCRMLVQVETADVGDLAGFFAASPLRGSKLNIKRQ